MNVCLVSAPVATDFKKRDEIDSCLGEPAVSEPQLGILNLGAVLEARRQAVRIIDLDQAYLEYLDLRKGCPRLPSRQLTSFQPIQRTFMGLVQFAAATR